MIQWSTRFEKCESASRASRSRPVRLVAYYMKLQERHADRFMTDSEVYRSRRSVGFMTGSQFSSRLPDSIPAPAAVLSQQHIGGKSERDVELAKQCERARSPHRGIIALALRLSRCRRENHMWLRAHLESSHFPRRVLVVEPSSSECSRLCQILAAGEMEVYPAGDLITAVSAVASFEPDLILSQLRLPTHSGFTLVRRIKEDDATRAVPVILYSDLTTAAERIRALDLGALDLITEPIVSAELIARVRAALKARHASCDSGAAISKGPSDWARQPQRARGPPRASVERLSKTAASTWR